MIYSIITIIKIIFVEEDSCRPEVSNSYQFHNYINYHRKHKIEVENGWDVFKIINFISFMPLNYHSLIRRTTVEHFDKIVSIEEGDKIIFEIYLTNGLERQQVFLRNYTPWIFMDQYSYYVKKVQWSLDKPETHPLIQFGKHFARSGNSPCQLLIAAFKGVFKRPRCSDTRMSSNLTNEEKLEELLKGLPGYVEVAQQENVDGGFQLSEVHMLQRITWVCAWCPERLKDTQYIQLDGSFKATSPYCYCCVNSILNNESMTVAISIGISENSELYESTYMAIEQCYPRELLNRIPVLSDMGKGLISFCLCRRIQQFFCHRHILERFGHKILRNWAQRLLECTSAEQYSLLSLQISLEIQIWCSQQHDPKLIPEKIKDIQCMIDPNSDSLYNVKRWGIWFRSPYHIARCTNHSESLHRVMNMECKFYQDFIIRLTKIFKIIIRRFTNHHESHGRSLKSKYNKLKGVVARNIILKEWNVENYSLHQCNCGWNDYYTNLFGIRFPCIHEISNELFSKCPDPPQLKIPQCPPGNHIKKIISDNIQKFPRNKDHEKINISRNSYENKHHQINIKTKGENTLRSLKEFWSVIREMKLMYNVSEMSGVDIAMYSFFEWGLMNEETATTENIAQFRIQCWGEAEKFSLNKQ